MSSIHRTRRQWMANLRHMRAHPKEKGECTLCTVRDKPEEILKEHKYFREIINLFPYNLWDSSKVADHKMLVPKRHILSLTEFTEDEMLEYYKITSQYEHSGYDVYSRGFNSSTKSVSHQHTHLIKVTGKTLNFLFYLRKPFINLSS